METEKDTGEARIEARKTVKKTHEKHAKARMFMRARSVPSNADLLKQYLHSAGNEQPMRENASAKFVLCRCS